MTNRFDYTTDSGENISVLAMLLDWRRRFKCLSSDAVLGFVKREIDRQPEITEAPQEFARRLLLTYKVSSTLSADDMGHIPFEISHCFARSDMHRILNSDHRLLSRLVLCTLDKHDFEEGDSDLVKQILCQLEGYAEVRLPDRSPIRVQRDSPTLRSAKGALRIATGSRLGSRDTSPVTQDHIYHLRRFQV